MRPSHVARILWFASWLLLASALSAAEVKDVAYRSGDETVHGLLFAPSGKGPFPGLLAIHAVFGLDEWTREQASKLANAGYLVLALDFYQGKVAQTLDDGVQLSRAVPMTRKQQDVLAAIHFLRSQANVIQDRIGSIGWCMGGTWAFNLATLDPLLKVAVIRYGHASTEPSLLGKINARVFGIFGAKDTSIRIQEIRSFEQQMKSLGKQVEIIIYPEAGHAFEYPESTAKTLGLVKAAYPADSAYQGPRPDDSADAWKRTVDFLDANLKSAKSVGGPEQEVLALEEQMDALLRSNSPERTALWAEEMVYINNNGAVFDKTRLAAAVSAGEVKMESLEVTERKIRVYGDLAVVTALERMRASFHGKESRDHVQRYTRIWARRSGKWQMVSFQATEATDTAPQSVGFEACSSEHATAGSAPTVGSTEEMILRLEDQHREGALKGDIAKGTGWLGDDYLAITSAGIFDKAYAKRQFDPGGTTKRLALELADRRVRLFGDAAIVTGIWCTRTLREGKESAGAGRYTRVWVKRNANWQVVSWQITPIVPPAPSSAAYAADNPFVGTWKLNLTKSRISSPDGIRPLPLVKSIVTYKLVRNEVQIVDDDTFTDDHSIHMEWIGKFDGKDYPVTGDPNADSWSFEEIDGHTLGLTTKKNGKEIATRRVTVSADGKTRILTGTRADASGKTIAVTAVYEKE
jgi:carboxymethylenebutenolidase